MKQTATMFITALMLSGCVTASVAGLSTVVGIFHESIPVVSDAVKSIKATIKEAKADADTDK